MSFHQNSDNNTGGERESKLKSYMGDGKAGVLTYAIHFKFAGWLE